MIREIKRYVLETADKKKWKPRILSAVGTAKKQKVAVIGSGPAGLSCAYDLARAGYKVTVFEAASRLGGMLVSAIPSFRLDPADVDREIAVIKNLGVEFVTGKALGRDITIGGLKKKGFKAIFAGIGAQDSVKLGIPGEDIDGSIGAIEFLDAARSKKRLDLSGKRIAIVGGGFTAMDTARTAVRLGTAEVYILYRRTKEEMPATAEELREAEEEGVRVMYQVAPQIVIGDRHVTGIRCLHYVLGDKDKSGRRRPVEVPDTEFTLAVDFVVAAISQKVGTSLGQDVELTPWGTIKADESTGETNVAGVYAGGDCAKGPSNVISAIADGKRAAASIDTALSGEKALLAYDGEKTMSDRESALRRHGQEPRIMRVAPDVESPARRRKTFDEYRSTLSAEQARKEASRCLACGCGAGCEICKDICKMFAWCTDPQGRVLVDEKKCVACGMCVHRCPNNNIEMIQTSDKPI